jgi:hypothetical protein
MVTKFGKLDISDKDSDHRNCSYCNKPYTEKLWCKECDPHRIMEGWSSGNPDIDKLIKDSIYDNAKNYKNKHLNWVSFDKFTNIKEIGEGGFAKVYSATWIDKYDKYEKVALKRLNGSQNMSDRYLNEVRSLMYLLLLI